MIKLRFPVSQHRSLYREVSMLIHDTESSLTHDAPNVIHMTVKPQEVVDEEDAKGGKSYSARDRETTDRSPGCRCVIL